jgi:ATP-binding cassette subfamily B (MDR/TAP) protein 1
MLICKERWYDQPTGTIYLDGVDIRELNLHWLRTNVRLVQQEPVLFSGTVFENVAYGLFGTEKANLPTEEQRALVKKACKDAYADEFIDRLPKVSPDLYTWGFLAHAGSSRVLTSAGLRYSTR